MPCRSTHRSNRCATGLLPGVRQVLSPHFDARPAGSVPTLIVVHGISLPPGEFGGPWIDRLFTGTLPAGRASVLRSDRRAAGLRARAHPPRRRDHPVRALRRARLACRACPSTAAATACNDFSIGIELEGTDETPYTDAAVRAARRARRRRSLHAYPSLRAERIVGHSDIAPGARPIRGRRSSGRGCGRCCARACGRSSDAARYLRRGRAARALRCRARGAPAPAPCTNSRSERRLRYFTTSGLTLSALASVHTRRSARRAMARARWQAAAAGPPPGRMNSFSGGRPSLNASSCLLQARDLLRRGWPCARECTARRPYRTARAALRVRHPMHRRGQRRLRQQHARCSC